MLGPGRHKFPIATRSTGCAAHSKHSSMAVTDDYVREANKKRIVVDIARAINEREAERDAIKRRATLRVK